MKRKRGLVHVILALLMSMLLVVSTGCGKSGSGDSSSDKKTDKTETLADVNTIPEDGVITKEQFKTIAGENKKVQFKGTTDDGITYIWTYDCSKIQLADCLLIDIACFHLFIVFYKGRHLAWTVLF